MARKASREASRLREGSSRETTALAVVVTPLEMEAEQSSQTSRLGSALATASAKAKIATAAANGAVTAAKSVAQRAGRSAGKAAKAGASTINNAASGAARVSGRASEKAATAAAATYHYLGDLNGDGRFDAEDLRIAKATLGKVAVEVGGEALELGKAALQHQLVRDAAAGAVVGGAIASAVPFVGVPFGAAVGAAAVLVRGGSGAGSTTAAKVIDKSVRGATALAAKRVKTTPKTRTKRSRAKAKP